MADPIVNPAETFERVYCINLDRRPDRWKRFAENVPDDWPFPAPVRVPAIDGKRVKHPGYWRPGPGAWGCFRSHLRTIEQCLNEGVRSVLLLEDDALFPPDFTTRVLAWLKHVPADWQMLYLGGQHLFAGKHPPRAVGPELFQPYNVNRTHAFALQGDMLQIVYHHLLRQDWKPRNHIDHHLGRLHQQRKHRIYCPPEWLVGQASGKSNISGREPPDRFWPAAKSVATAATPAVRPDQPAKPSTPFVAIVGLHSSGSSALAGALWHLGLWFGEPAKLTGYWGRDTTAKGAEHRDLAGLLEAALPFRGTEPAKPRRWLWRRLSDFIRVRQTEAAARGLVAAAKYPQLCQAGRQLRTICGDGLRVIVCRRPDAESVQSIIRRTRANGDDAARLTAHQRWLAAGRDSLAAAIPGQVYQVDYADVLADPPGQLSRLAAWLGLSATPEQHAAAIASIRPELRHIATEAVP